MTDDYHPFDSDLPRVQIPLGADRAGLTVNGEFRPLYELPDAAAEAYMQFARQGGNIRIWQCDTCGYLTDAEALKTTSYDTYTCSNCGASQGSRGLQRSATGSFTRVHGPMIEPDDERFVDVLSAVPASKCEAAHESDDGRECPNCVPNHPSHLGKLQNAVGGEITQSEMLRTVAEACDPFVDA